MKMLFKGFILYIRLNDVHSLKEKRSIIKPVISEIKRKFNVSVIECGAQNHLSQLELGLAIASLTTKDMEQTLNKIEHLVEVNHNLIIFTIEEI